MPTTSLARQPAQLSVTGLSKSFTQHLRGGATRTVLADINLHVPAGSCVMLTGPSGSGKSSLLRCLFRTYRPDTGRVVVTVGEHTSDLASASDRDVLALRATTIGMASQFLHVIPRVSAVDLVTSAGVPAEQAGERLVELGLAAELVTAPPATFSGGERQIVNIAIALAAPRPLLLLDEVTASLDPQRRAWALAALRAHKQAGTTMLTVFHDRPDTAAL
jgi:alpha-D-ribose 1-methylphosphonate 5-triphosphate synthase subunit PhnL